MHKSDVPMSDGRTTVFMAPDYSKSNPYQTALIEAVETHDVDVVPIDVEGVAPIMAAWRRHGRPDVVHVHWLHKFIVPAGGSILLCLALSIRLILSLFILRMRGVAIVWTVHNVLDHERTAPRLEALTRHVAARLADRIIVHCDRAESIIVDAYKLPSVVRERVIVIPHGNYDGHYGSVEPERTPSELVFLYFGMIRPYKNVPTLIDTFRELDRSDVRLQVVGNPWNEELAADIRAAAGNDDRVHLELSFVPDEEVAGYFERADAVVLPFDRVLTSGSAILAMTFGRPVIAPAHGCLPELIGEYGGILYDGDGDAPLGRALREAIADPEALVRMGERNRRVAAQLDWQTVGRRTVAAYRTAGV